MTPGWRGRLALLVLQATPFCNLDCRYCYLPDRGDRRRMSAEVLDATLSKVFAAGLPAAELSIVWHAGEPTAIEPAWYERAFAQVARHAGAHPVQHHFQTNAVLIDDSWCSFFRQHRVRVGVSIDGPHRLHDAQRVGRDGRGTHDKVMRGIARLRAAGVPFTTICVLTRESLAHADEVFDFFATLGAESVGFNVEEAEALHASSSLMASGAEAQFRRFFARIVERWRAAGEMPRLREIESVKARLRRGDYGHARGEAQNQAGEILNVAFDGGFSTWSPELLGTRHPRFDSFVLGNVLHDDLPPTVWPGAAAAAREEIAAGVRRCRAGCKYFDLCLGGAPANKLGEHGRFDVTETMHCRLTQQAVADGVLDMLAAQYLAPPATPAAAEAAEADTGA